MAEAAEPGLLIPPGRFSRPTTGRALCDRREKSTENTMATPFQWSSFNPTSNVHSAPIYVSLKDRPGIEHSARARTIATTWLARLEDLETVLAEDNMEYLAPKLAIPDFDAVPKETLLNNRLDLLKEIQTAKDFFKTLSQENPS